ncbi:hypothetical protein GCM10023235_78410 [Kitasatospora terrestris]|uniref:Uncharacterized protein n=1 Tax=Kitasatospora terrestris TaxID=258051 RepID=A0ABP9ETB1_9ACTN
MPRCRVASARWDGVTTGCPHEPRTRLEAGPPSDLRIHIQFLSLLVDTHWSRPAWWWNLRVLTFRRSEVPGPGLAGRPAAVLGTGGGEGNVPSIKGSQGPDSGCRVADQGLLQDRCYTTRRDAIHALY